jgi:uncharacterized protein (TIGR02453 family)
MTRNSFHGFPEELFIFLEALRENNNRDWFNANKDSYRHYVVEPVSEFIQAMSPRLGRITDSYLADPRPNGGSMFRIYRDIRFSKDKRPYKTHVGCHFRHMAGKDAHAPGFYVHLEPGKVLFGGGVWKPPGPTLAQIRASIAERPEEWTRISQNKSLRKRFGPIQGERLKRPPRGYEPDQPCIEDLKLKSLFLIQEEEADLALTPDLIKEIVRSFKTAAPFMQFLTTALELPFNRKPPTS